MIYLWAALGLAFSSISFYQRADRGANQDDSSSDASLFQEKMPGTSNYDYRLEDFEQNRSSLDDPDYALGTNKLSFYFPYHFSRLPNYSHNLSLKSLVLPGDIVYERNQIGAIGHVGVVLDYCGSTSGSFIRTIEAVGASVQYCFLDEVRFVEKSMSILRVNNRTMYYQDALLFAEEQIGDPYSFPISPRVNTSITDDEWYCSELVYAAYLYAGINVVSGSGYTSGNHLLPEYIYGSSSNSQLAILPQFLFLSLLGKNGFDWNVEIYNTQTSKEVYYAQKMCWSGSARDWKENELLDITHFTAAAYSHNSVVITENWFATSIATSFVCGDVRCISFAYYLDEATLTLSRNYSYQWS